MNLLTYDDNNFAQEVLQSIKPTLVIFSAEWCAPCHATKLNMEHIASEYRTIINVGVVDIDECPNLVAKYKIKGVPTIYLINNGNIVERLDGLASKKVLINLVDKFFEENKTK